MTTPDFLDDLHSVAEAKEQEESAFRTASRRQLEALERERAHAFRRYNLLKDMVAAAGDPEAEPCIQSQLAVALAETGWSEAKPGYPEVRERLGRVAAVIHAHLHPPATNEDVPASATVTGVVTVALVDFELWHRERFGQDFLDLLGREAPSFQPLVDF
jgi:hypothetical protein